MSSFSFYGVYNQKKPYTQLFKGASNIKMCMPCFSFLILKKSSSRRLLSIPGTRSCGSRLYMCEGTIYCKRNYLPQIHLSFIQECYKINGSIRFVLNLDGPRSNHINKQQNLISVSSLSCGLVKHDIVTSLTRANASHRCMPVQQKYGTFKQSSMVICFSEWNPLAPLFPYV